MSQIWFGETTVVEKDLEDGLKEERLEDVESLTLIYSRVALVARSDFLAIH